jgi:replicative DNA helicase
MFGKVVFIDYLQIVPMKGSERQVLIKNLLDQMRVLANKHGFLIFMLSQLTPDYNNPIHDAPREAKDIHFSSDMVIRLWSKEQEYDHPIYDHTKGNYVIHVTHNRDGEAGVVLGFNFEFGVNYSFVERGDKVQVRRKQKDNDVEKKLNQVIELMVMNKGVI